MKAVKVSRGLSNAIEALVGTGELVHAESLAGRLEEHARAMAVPSAIAAGARCRALVLAQGGDLRGARSSIEAALAAHARLREPFELGDGQVREGTELQIEVAGEHALDAAPPARSSRARAGV